MYTDLDFNVKNHFYQIFSIKFEFLSIEIMEFFILEPIIGLAIGKYLIKTIFNIKIEIGIFEISNVSNLNKS